MLSKRRDAFGFRPRQEPQHVGRRRTVTTSGCYCRLTRVPPLQTGRTPTPTTLPTIGLRLLCRSPATLPRARRSPATLSRRLAPGSPTAYGSKKGAQTMLDTARAVRTRVHGWRHSHSPRLSIDHRQEEQGGVEGRRGAATDGGTPSEVEAAATQRAAPLGLRRGQLRKAWSAGWRTARLIYRQIQTNEASVHGLHARSVCRNAQGSEAGHMARVDAAKRRAQRPSCHRWSGPTVMLAS